MKLFAALYDAIDRTTSTNAKVAAMAAYFAAAPPRDAAWAVFFLTGRRLKRLLPYASIHDWTTAATGIESWLLDECYAIVGDGAETAALILDQLPVLASEELTLAEWVETRVMTLRGMDPYGQQRLVTTWWRGLDRLQRFMLLKLLTGELRVGVSQTLVVRALAQTAGLPPTTLAARLMGEWQPSAEWLSALLSHERTDDDRSRPYPFFLAAPLEDAVTTLGNPAEWLVEWKWDGIRAQLVKREGAVHLWSRGEELITERFPEIAAAAADLADNVVVDGEVLAFRDGRPMPFAALQQRIGRQQQVARLARSVPVVLMVYDLIEQDGVDIRALPLADRRVRMVAALDAAARASRARPAPGAATASGSLFDDLHEPPGVVDPEAQRPAVLQPSAVVEIDSWDELATLRSESRARGVEGVMIKRLTSPYGVGRKRGDWWKWKIEPYTVDAVLIYAQPGSGKRASLLTDYTFGVWDNGELVPFAKAYSGLSNDEIAEVDAWIRRHTRERFGPVRHVEPTHVFELGFEAIAASSRHRSGIAVRFPRMLRWRKDKRPDEADSLDTVRGLIR